MKGKTSLMNLLPVLFSFYIVGLSDIIGVSMIVVQDNFQLGDAAAGLLPAAVFIWYLLLAVPAALLKSRVGGRRTVLYGMALTVLGMVVPWLLYSLAGCFVGFMLLGMGNVMLQLALNPLLAGMVTRSALAGALTSGQMIKGVSAFCGPFVVAFAISYWGHWYYSFAVFALLTVVSALWLSCTSVQEFKLDFQPSLRETFSLLKVPGIPLLFLAAVIVAGMDVGMNILTPKLMMERCGHSVQDAILGSSVYFAFRTLGTFVSTMLLASLSEMKYLRMHILIALAAVVALFFAEGEYFILLLVGMVGFGCSSIFLLICSSAIRVVPDKVNNISLLMMTGLSGGAIIPLLMGVASACIGSQIGALIIIAACILYLAFCALRPLP